MLRYIKYLNSSQNPVILPLQSADASNPDQSQANYVNQQLLLLQPRARYITGYILILYFIYYVNWSFINGIFNSFLLKKKQIFVADGYCNNRILKFNAAGRILRVIPQPPEFLSLQVPHGLTLLEHLDLICIADRENMRVVCPRCANTNQLILVH